MDLSNTPTAAHLRLVGSGCLFRQTPEKVVVAAVALTSAGPAGWLAVELVGLVGEVSSHANSSVQRPPSVAARIRLNMVSSFVSSRCMRGVLLRCVTARY